MLSKSLLVLSSICMAVLLSACGRTSPSRLYVLSHVDIEAPTATSNFAVAIDPVRIPDHLERSVVISKKTKEELHFSETDRWGGPLEDNVTAVIRDNLSAYLKSSQVYESRFGSPLTPVVAAISLKEFSGKLGDSATLEARWVLSEDDYNVSFSGSFSIPLENKSMPEYVSTLSDLLAELSKEIAQDIEEFYEGREKRLGK